MALVASVNGTVGICATNSLWFATPAESRSPVEENSLEMRSSPTSSLGPSEANSRNASEQISDESGESPVIRADQSARMQLKLWDAAQALKRPIVVPQADEVKTSPAVSNGQGSLTDLAEVAGVAEEELNVLPPLARRRAKRFEKAMLHAVETQSLSHAANNEMRSLRFGGSLKDIERQAIARCAAWKEAPAIRTVLEEIIPHARRAGDQILQRVQDLLTQVVTHVSYGFLPAGVLPTAGFSVEVDPRTHNAHVCAVAGGAATAIVYALLALRRTFVAFCDCAIALSEVAMLREGADSELAARILASQARAVKRDICLLAGTYTNLINAAFRDAALVLSVAAVVR